jgi:hypothetical protein
MFFVPVLGSRSSLGLEKVGGLSQYVEVALYRPAVIGSGSFFACFWNGWLGTGSLCRSLWLGKQEEAGSNMQSA